MVNNLEFKTKHLLDEEAEIDEVATAILVDGNDLQIAINASLQNNNLEERDLISPVGLHPKILYVHLMALKYWFSSSNYNLKNSSWIMSCDSCFANGCNDVYVEILKEKEFVTWQNFSNHSSPTTQMIDSLGPFHFDRKQYENELKILKSFIDKNWPFEDGEIIENNARM